MHSYDQVKMLSVWRPQRWMSKSWECKSLRCKVRCKQQSKEKHLSSNKTELPSDSVSFTKHKEIMWNRPEGKNRKLFMQRQQAGNGSRVGIFTLRVGHLGSIVHQLWLHLNTRQFWCKHPPFMLPESCTPSSQDVAPLCCWQRFTPKTPLDVNPSPAAPSPSQIGVFISRIMRAEPRSSQITNKNATNSDKF